jgi:hypothetical protein
MSAAYDISKAVKDRLFFLLYVIKYGKQDQLGKVALNERNPHTTQEKEPVAGSPKDPYKIRAGNKAEHEQANHFILKKKL